MLWSLNSEKIVLYVKKKFLDVIVTHHIEKEEAKIVLPVQKDVQKFLQEYLLILEVNHRINKFI